MKVCFISHSSGKAGAELALLELIDALKERGVKCYVMLPSYGPLIDELKNREVPYCVLPYKWWMSNKNSPMWKRIAKTLLNCALIIPMAAIIKRWNCDIIYTNTITIWIGAIVAKVVKRPHVWHIHEFGYEDHGLFFDLGQKFSLRIMEKLSSAIIANSKAVAQKYQQYFALSKLKVVYYSVTIPKSAHNNSKVTLSQPADGKIKCIIVGSLQEGKRQEDAIMAISELVRMGIGAKLYVVGDGKPKYKKYLNDLVIEHDLESHVEFVGYTEDPFSFIQRADVLLMCSKMEAFGRVTIEAMKLGKPVIGARSGGTVELIRDGFNGLLYTPGDYRELADKIRYLYEHPNVARQMGENGQRWATEKFTQARYGEEVLTVLRQCIKAVSS